MHVFIGVLDEDFLVNLPLKSVSEHAIFKIFLRGHAPRPPSNALHNIQVKHHLGNQSPKFLEPPMSVCIHVLWICKPKSADLASRCAMLHGVSAIILYTPLHKSTYLIIT